jgi:hypothetical protein
VSAPVGLGWWCAFESAIDKGNKERDLEVAIERCKVTGASWVALRGGDGSANDRDTNAESIKAFVDAGIDVFVWIFARPDRAAQESFGYKSFVDQGASGAIINAEFEYQKTSAIDARALVDAIRKAGVDWVAHAPPDYAGSANTNPWNALDEACDAVMPQVYAWEHNDSGHVSHLDEVKKRYLTKGTPIEKVWPILCSYRPKTRGFDAKTGKAIATPKMADEGLRVAQDLIAGLEHEWVKSAQAPSIYSLDAVTFINGSEDKTIEALARWHQGNCTTEPPATIEDPLGEARLRLVEESERLTSNEWSDVS